jgi:uncharacterized protein YbjT (DUF2867 family)
MYAVTGITGQVGGVVGHRLLEAGLPVRAVVRNADKGRPWGDRGCEVALAEMDDAAALRQAFEGAEAVFVLLPPTFDPSPGFPEAKRTIEAIREALAATRPSRVVCLSTIGAQAHQPNLLNQLGLMEQVLGTLDLPIAFLRAGWFMENSQWDLQGARENGEIASFLQPTDRAVPMVATDDVGSTAAALLQEHWQGPRVVELEGPTPVSPDQIAAAFSRAIDRPVHATAVPRTQWESLFHSQGMHNPLPRMQMLDGFNQGWIAFQGSPAEQRKGTTSIDAVARALVART